MSDLNHGRTNRDVGKTPDKTFLTSLSDELIVALQEARSSAKKQQKPAANQLIKPEHRTLPAQPALKGPIPKEPGIKTVDSALLLSPQTSNSAIPATLRAPTLVLQQTPHQAKYTEASSLPKTNLVDTSRTIVDSAVSLLRAGIQKVSEVRLRPGENVDMQSPPAAKVMKSGSKEMPAIISYRGGASATVEVQSDNHRNAVSAGGKDVHIDYGQSFPPAEQLKKELMPSTLWAPEPKTLLVAQNINLDNNPAPGDARNVIAADAGIRTASLQVSQMPEDTFLKVPPKNDSAIVGAPIKDVRQIPEQSRSLVGAVTVTGVTDIPKPGINVAINVRSFSVDGQPKPILPNSPVPLPPLHSMQPQLAPIAPIYRTQAPGTYSVFNSKLEAADTETVPNSKNLKPSDKRYALGTEIALVALTAAAGASRRRMETKGSQRKRQDEELNNESATDEESAVSETAANIPARKRPTMLISRQDNLVHIAEKRFDDANLGWLIAQLNRDVSNQVELDGKFLVEFESRQEIVLPAWDDIVEFYESNRGRPFDNSRLITIVKQTMVDQELLESTLGPLFSS